MILAPLPSDAVTTTPDRLARVCAYAECTAIVPSHFRSDRIYCRPLCSRRAYSKRRLADGRHREYKQRPESREISRQWRDANRVPIPCKACGTITDRFKYNAHRGATCENAMCMYFTKYGRWPVTELKWSHPVRSTLIPPDHPARTMVCANAECAQKFAREWFDQIYCARTCMYIVKQRRMMTGKPRFLSGECVWCGEWFVSDRLSGQSLTDSYCTPKCGRAMAKYTRAARKRGQYVAPVSRIKILIRDKWTCKLCLKPIPRNALPGDMQYGTVDHIVPLSRNGTHEPSNAQAAHLLCNSLKGDRV